MPVIRISQAINALQIATMTRTSPSMTRESPSPFISTPSVRGGDLVHEMLDGGIRPVLLVDRRHGGLPRPLVDVVGDDGSAGFDLLARGLLALGPELALELRGLDGVLADDVLVLLGEAIPDRLGDDEDF